MKYGEELIRQLEAEIELMQGAIDRREERIARWETDEDDCFISQRCEERTIATNREKIALIRDGGCAWFTEYATAMFVGDVTRGQIDSIDETFTAEDIQAYDEILHNALQESDIEDFLAEHAHSVQKQADRDQALADALASHKDIQLSGSGDDLTNFRLHYDAEINNGEGGYNLIADRTSAPLIKDMSISVLSDDISFDTFKDFLSSHDLAFESVIDTIVPEKQATEEEVLFSQADLVRFLAEHTLSSDEWEDMAYPLFDSGYLDKHNTAFMRDLATQLSVVQRPTNSEFWQNPKFGQSEWAANQLFTDLVTRTIVIEDTIPPVAG